MKCDICNNESKHLVDYFCLICNSCKNKHTDLILLKKIGFLMEKIIDIQEKK